MFFAPKLNAGLMRGCCGGTGSDVGRKEVFVVLATVANRLEAGAAALAVAPKLNAGPILVSGGGTRGGGGIEVLVEVPNKLVAGAAELGEPNEPKFDVRA